MKNKNLFNTGYEFLKLGKKSLIWKGVS